MGWVRNCWRGERETCWPGARGGCVPPGNELRGKRVAVQIDGGRVRTRRPVSSRGRPGKRGKFRTDWREPKLLIIFELDEHGRMQRKSRPWIDGTLEGPEAWSCWRTTCTGWVGRRSSR